MSGGKDIEVGLRISADADDAKAGLDSVKKALEETTKATQDATTAEEKRARALAQTAATAQQQAALAAAKQKLAESSGQNAQATDAEKEALARLTAVLDPAAIKAQVLAKAQESLQTALAKGLVTQDQHTKLMAAAQQRWGDAGGAADKASAAVDRMSGVIGQAAGKLATGTLPSFRELSVLVGAVGVPIAAAVGAVGALVDAYVKGGQEATAYAKAIAMSGNVAGVTSDQLATAAANVDKVIGTQAQAAQVLAQMVQSGKIAPDNLERFAAVAIQAQRDIGQSTDETVKILSELGGKPVEASAKLNESLHYLSATVFEQIKALQDQGREDDAAAVAQAAYADAVKARSSPIEESLGTLQKAWRGIKSAAAEAWDAMLNIGRDDPNAKLKALSTELGQIQTDMLRGDVGGFGAKLALAAGAGDAVSQSTAQAQARIAAITNEIGAINDRRYAKESEARADAARQKQDDARIKFDQDGEQFLSKQAKMERELTQARTEGAAAGMSQAAIEQRLSDIRAKYQRRAGTANTGLRDANAQAKTAMAQIQANLAQLEQTFKASDAVILAAYQDGSVSLDAAYTARLTDLQTSTEVQKKALQDQLAQVETALKKAKTTVEKAPLLTKQLELKAKIVGLDASLDEGQRKLSIWKNDQEKQLANITAQVRVQVANLTGDFDVEAVEQQIKASMEKQYIAAGQLSNPEDQQEQIARLNALKQAAVAQAGFNFQLSEAQRLQSQLQVTEQAINTERDKGNISQTEAEAQIKAAREAQVPALQAIIDKLGQMRDAMPPNMAAAIDSMNTSIDQLQNTANAATPTVQTLGQQLRNTLVDNLGDAMASVVTDFGNLRSNIANVLKQIASDIVKSGVKEALQSVFGGSKSGGSGGGLFGAIANLFGGGNSSLSVGSGASSFSGSSAFLDDLELAEGGLVSGPGTATSDSIPAQLSNGEFVQPAHAVRHYGPGFMEALRTLQFPRPRYAFGGLVQAHQRARFATGGLVAAGGGQSAAPNVSIQITNTGTPQRSTRQDSYMQGRDMVVQVVLDDYRNGGPISRLPKRT